MAAGFEDEAYAAALLLIHYQDQLAPQIRIAFAQYLAKAGHDGQTGIQRSKKGEYFFWLNQIRLGAFGVGFDDEAVTHQAGLIANPWALTDLQFSYCIFTLRQGRDPDPEKFEKLMLTGEARKVADKIGGKLEKDAFKVIEKGLAMYGGRAIGMVLKIKNLSWVGLALDILKDYLSEQLAKYERAQLLARYEIDEVRRLYLTPQGLSSYKRLDPPTL